MQIIKNIVKAQVPPRDRVNNLWLNGKDLYAYIGDKWTKIGYSDSTDVQLDELRNQIQSVETKANTLQSGKVDKVSGKGLSTNDYTTEEKSKLAGLNNYGKATTSADGLMSSIDKSKLDDIAAGANNYTLPTATASTLGGVKIGSGLTVTNGILSATGGGVADSVAWTNVTGKPAFSTVATSGSYNDLANKPAIPAVANATVTITQAGQTKGTFTLNQSDNITVALADTNTTYSAATTTANGLMSSEDKTYLDSIKGLTAAKLTTLLAIVDKISQGYSINYTKNENPTT